VVLQCAHQVFIARMKPLLEHAEGLDDHATLVIGLADHAAFGDCRVAQQGVFHLGAPTL
jgi:hypothetical protein